MSEYECRCNGCKKRPDELAEYIDEAKAMGLTPEQYVRREEGTFNTENGHFLCTSCYVKAGCPTLPGPYGWKAP